LSPGVDVTISRADLAVDPAAIAFTRIFGARSLLIRQVKCERAAFVAP
jgi:hypothetical protein